MIAIDMTMRVMRMDFIFAVLEKVCKFGKVCKFAKGEFDDGKSEEIQDGQVESFQWNDGEKARYIKGREERKEQILESEGATVSDMNKITRASQSLPR
jgi:hypothetical protein